MSKYINYSYVVKTKLRLLSKMCHLTVGKSWKFVQNRQLIWFSGGNLKVILSCSGGEDCRLIIKIRSFIVKICSWL